MRWWWYSFCHWLALRGFNRVQENLIMQDDLYEVSALNRVQSQALRLQEEWTSFLLWDACCLVEKTGRKVSGVLTEAQSICCGYKKWKPLTSPDILIREGFLEVVTFSKARKYKQAFVRWRGEGKEGNSSLREWEGDGQWGWSVFTCIWGVGGQQDRTIYEEEFWGGKKPQEHNFVIFAIRQGN